MLLTSASNSQGQGPARRPARQGHFRQALQGCSIVPSRDRRHSCRQTEDQRIIGTQVPQGLGGEGPDQASGGTQQDEDL